MSDCEYDIALFFIWAILSSTQRESGPKSNFAYRSYVFLSKLHMGLSHAGS